MPIKAQSADGVIHEFPDNTDPSVVDKVMKTYAQEHADKTTFLGEAERGFMDPLEGAAQLLSHVVPKSVEEKVNAANNWLAEKTGLVALLPPGGMDQRVQEREAQIEKERGINKNKIDWGRMAGDILNPTNYLPFGIGKIGEAGKLANVGRAALAGTGAAALQPTARKDFAASKAEQMGLGGILGGTFGVAGGVVSKGVEKLGEYIVRKHPEALENRAVQKILKRIGQDEKAGGPSATTMLDLINESEKPTTLTDVAGANVRGLAGNVARQPGESRGIATQFLHKRDEQAAQRLASDIDKYIFSGQSAHQATESLLQARSTAARPAYDAAHALQGVWSPRLEEFLHDPAIQKGLTRGYEIERLLSLAEGRPLTTTQMGVDLDIDGNIKILDKPNMRLLDMAKQGLDAMIADERNDLTGRLSARGVALNKMRHAYVDEIDKLDTHGVYNKARQAWAGYSKSLDAVRAGRSVFQRSPEENAKMIGELSPGEREFYLLGLADQLRERLAKTGFTADEARSLIKNPWMRDQLRPAFKTQESFDKFVDAVANEGRMFGTRRKILGGSETAERHAEDAEDARQILEGAHLAHNIAHGHMIRAAANAWRMYRDLGLRPDPKLNAKIAQILFATPIDPTSRVGKKLLQELPSEPRNALGNAGEVLSGLSVPGAAGLAAEGVPTQPAGRQ